MVKHKVYTGWRVRGSTTDPFGKCLCGAVLEGHAEIDRHRRLA
jgi:hypothetical protein